MRSRPLACLVLSMVAVVFAQTARGDILAQYSFTDVTAGQLNRGATTVAPNVTAGNITDAPIVFGNPMVVLNRATDIGYATQPVLAASRAAFNESNIRDNVYFTLTVSADAGYELVLSSLTFNVARGGAATPRDYDIRSSLDGFAMSLTGIVEISTQRPTFTPVLLDLSGVQFQNLSSPLTFQFRYMTQAFQFGQNVDFDDITLNGLVAPVPVGLTGDHNGDGQVDAADYVAWRKSPDDFGDDPDGYDDWRQNFGDSSDGSGNNAPVPEPATYLSALIAATLVAICRRLR